nr:opine metallophore biosynthesis dehydrogenase [Paenibacillus silagei]
MLGTGPVTVQLAVLFKNHFGSYLGIAGRISRRSELMMAALHADGNRLYTTVQNDSHRRLAGECRADEVFQGYRAVTGTWDTLIVSVTADAYLEVLRSLDTQLLTHVRCVILVSPTLGSNRLVHHYIQETGSKAEIISCSTYLGDTRWIDGMPSNNAITTGVKTKVFIGSSQPASHHLHPLKQLYDSLGIMLVAMGSPLEAESRNISLFVHPPLFMNSFSLKAIFDEDHSRKYVYKLFPEGPITPQLIHEMVECWRELSALLEALDLQSVNLLKFMTVDNYPVRAESLPQHIIECFDSLEPIHQEYLVYVRYASLLIDPFSEPDLEGRYYDFSAVPIQSVFRNREGVWDIPRMPKEDYYRIKIIQGIAGHMKVSCPTIDTFIDRYEQQLKRAAKALKGQPVSEAFHVRSFAGDIERICSNVKKLY